MSLYKRLYVNQILYLRGYFMARKTQISKEVILENAFQMLLREGYHQYGVGVPQVQNPSQKTITKVLAKPDIPESYAQQHYGPAYTFEISMSKIWDRAAGRRFPNSQFAYRRLAEQLLQVIGMLLSQP